MAKHAYEPLPPGWGALTTLRPSRRRARRMPRLVILAVLALALMLVAGLAARA